MFAFILLRGKEFALPDGVSSAIIGLFFGLVCSLFYYQHYYKAYFWWFSLSGGLFFTFLVHSILNRIPGLDPTSLEATLASFVIPFAMTLGLNHYFYTIKQRKRRKRLRRKVHSTFFDTVDAGTVLRGEAPKILPK